MSCVHVFGREEFSSFLCVRFFSYRINKSLIFIFFSHTFMFFLFSFIFLYRRGGARARLPRSR